MSQLQATEARLKEGKCSGALTKYDEGIYIIEKCREVRKPTCTIPRVMSNAFVRASNTTRNHCT